MYLRNFRLELRSGSSRLPPIHRTDIEGRQRVDLTRSASCQRRTAICAFRSSTAGSFAQLTPLIAVNATRMRTFKFGTASPADAGVWRAGSFRGFAQCPTIALLRFLLRLETIFESPMTTIDERAYRPSHGVVRFYLASSRRRSQHGAVRSPLLGQRTEVPAR
jgi:hypothetical protein